MMNKPIQWTLLIPKEVELKVEWLAELVAARIKRQANFDKTKLHDPARLHARFKRDFPSVNHDRDGPGDDGDDDEPLEPYGLVLKHTGRVPFSKREFSQCLKAITLQHTSRTETRRIVKARKPLAGRGGGLRKPMARERIGR
jgi:hypothetical protein